MKKNVKKLVSTLFALAVMMGITLFCSVDAEAAYKINKSYGFAAPEAVRMYSNNRTYDYSSNFTVYYAKKGIKILSVKANKSGLIGKVTRKTRNDYASVIEVNPLDPEKNVNYKYYGYDFISLFATKSGKYNVTIRMQNSKGIKFSKTVTVYVDYPGSPIKTINYAGTRGYGYSYISTKKGSGTLKISLNKGYKLKKLEYATTHDKNGNWVYKKTKNGNKITLAKTTKYSYTNTSDYSSDYNDYVYKSSYKYSYDYIKPVTSVRVTYYDEYLKTTNYTTFNIINVK